MTLDTHRLRLAPLTAAYLDDLVALDADPEVMRHINGGTPTPRRLYEEVLLARMLGAGGGTPGLGFFAAELRAAPGVFAGWFHLRPDVFEPAWLELGYRLRREHWGVGLATEGTRGLMALARNRWPDRRLSARTVPENAASRRVMEKCGLEESARFEYPARELPGLTLPATPGVLYLEPKTR